MILGGGKFSLVVASDVRAAEPGVAIRRLALPGEAIEDDDEARGAPVARCVVEELDPSCRYVLGVADGAQRRALLRALALRPGLVFPNVVHPLAYLAGGPPQGRGNLFGPGCHVGVAVALGSFNVINYHCCIGNHSHIGDNNFFSPKFNGGNSVQIGSDCYFGLGVIVTPGTEIHDGVTIQAGVTVSEVLPAHAHCASSARQKIIQLNQQHAT